ncbi:MAG: hypothetical protein MI806_23625, partial [Minwuiales bacterium]|nr:hypothetical protein [Minwuiales bacterium]
MSLPREQTGPILRSYRWAVFLLALGYWLYEFLEALDPASGFGWQFRYFTIWALTASLLSAWAVLRLSMGWTRRRPETLAGAAAAMNAVATAMYWKLHFQDPALVSGDRPILLWQ